MHATSHARAFNLHMFVGAYMFALLIDNQNGFSCTAPLSEARNPTDKDTGRVLNLSAFGRRQHTTSPWRIAFAISHGACGRPS
jgi:hypothetical protein